MYRWINQDSALFAWIVLAILITIYVVIYDVWAYKTGHLMMTTQFRRWLAEPVGGPIIAGLWIGIFVGLTYHFLVKGK
jgi:uncharacterized YccA/Bax inhibitor family protein